ncbi:MAG: flagellar hook-length control protein FliK [Deltaproteobacteria bacterium]|nr:flagellar hook-length control protein FliK [Deltaproteobacteria bacterium]MBZ0219291.1 flagellar hook-length control protein FliK [Deltaproteobacteria bacterium]
MKDAGETGLSFEFSHGEADGEHEALSQPERTAAAALPGTTFRNLVDSASAAYKPEPPAYAADMEKQLDEAVRISVRNGGGEVRMKLNPENLGELSIKLNLSNGAVTAEITAESHEAKALLEANSSMLKDSLAQQGLTLRECVINVNSRTETGLQERKEGLFEERREEAHGSGNDGKSGRKSGYNGSSQRKNQPAYGGIDLFA